MKGGLGSFAFKMGDLYVGAIVAVNAVGNIVDPDTGKVIAGSYDKENNMFIDKEASMMNDPEANESLNPATNTTCLLYTSYRRRMRRPKMSLQYQPMKEK